MESFIVIAIRAWAIQWLGAFLRISMRCTGLQD